MRIKVEIEIESTQENAIFLESNPLFDLWIQVKYERLSKFAIIVYNWVT